MVSYVAQAAVVLVKVLAILLLLFNYVPGKPSAHFHRLLVSDASHALAEAALFLSTFVFDIFVAVGMAEGNGPVIK